jgi:high-affinity iron transporter
MARASALLRSNPPATSDALVTLQAMRQELAPLVDEPARYGVLDAAIILLREGLEALLVVAALLAFLSKSGHADKQRWIWTGAGVGVLLSIGVALVIQRVFSSATAGASRELVEGLTGLVAAAMLLYVSYWLHSKSSMRAWQKYVRERTSTALAGGGMFSLSLISFLAVFREGAETSLFYIGIAPSIAGQDLALGIGLGTLALTVIGAVMLVFGVRIPLRPFFLVSSLLLYYLAFKFIGTGLHALQVAGVLPATPAAVPSWDPIGLFPTWETTVPQLALLVIAAGVLILSRTRARLARLEQAVT